MTRSTWGRSTSGVPVSASSKSERVPINIDGPYLRFPSADITGRTKTTIHHPIAHERIKRVVVDPRVASPPAHHIMFRTLFVVIPAILAAVVGAADIVKRADADTAVYDMRLSPLPLYVRGWADRVAQ
jgi:hypothetical protein